MVNNTIINAIRVHIYFTSILRLTLKGSNYYLLKNNEWFGRVYRLDNSTPSNNSPKRPKEKDFINKWRSWDIGSSMFGESSSTIIHVDSSFWSYIVTIPNINSFRNTHNHGKRKGNVLSRICFTGEVICCQKPSFPHLYPKAIYILPMLPYGPLP